MTNIDAERNGREISTIQFPYFDLEDAIGIAEAMHRRGGGVPMDRDQVSAALNSAGGTFANKLSAGKQFGLIDSQQGKWSLTALGFDILDSARAPSAKVEAFLNVELYKRAYEEFRGRLLPSKPGLEHAFTSFGVAQKQKAKARQTFERSARSAGFFPSGSEDRLVAPVIQNNVVNVPTGGGSGGAPAQSSTPIEVPQSQQANQAASPAFMGWLLDELPAPKSNWGIEEQANWLSAVAQAFRVVYKSDGGAVIVSIKKSDA